MATRKRIAKMVNQLLKESKFTVRAAAEAWGIDIATIHNARHAKGAVGAQFLIKLRDVVKMPIDEILGLPPLTEKAKVRTTAEQWKTTIAEAVDEAKAMGAPDVVIEHVLKTRAMNAEDDEERRRAWVRAILKTWTMWSLAPPITEPARLWLVEHPESDEPETSSEEEDKDPRYATG